MLGQKRETVKGCLDEEKKELLIEVQTKGSWNWSGSKSRGEFWRRALDFGRAWGGNDPWVS